MSEIDKCDFPGSHRPSIYFSRVIFITTTLTDTSPKPGVNGISRGRFGESLNEHFGPLSRLVIAGDADLGEKISAALESEGNLQEEWLLAGISALYYFVQCNWTGPEDTEDVVWLLGLRDEALRALALNEDCNENMAKPELLYFGKTIFSARQLRLRFKTCAWWALRANFLHEFVMEECSVVLLEQSEKLIREINESALIQDEYLQTLFNVEVAQFYLRYRRVQNSENHLNAALNAAGLTLNLRGAMGKRTKFQQEAKPQLYLDVAINKEIYPFRSCPDLPKPVELNDELRLERIEFNEVKARPELGTLEDSIILTKW